VFSIPYPSNNTLSSPTSFFSTALSSPCIPDIMPCSPIFFLLSALFSPYILDNALSNPIHFLLSALSSPYLSDSALSNPKIPNNVLTSPIYFLSERAF
jgi:hypothetical protein